VPLARGGAIGIAEPDETGDPSFCPSADQTRRTEDASGLFRWYNDYELPNSLGGGEITIRLRANEHDKTRGFEPDRERSADPPERPRVRPPLRQT